MMFKIHLVEHSEYAGHAWPTTKAVHCCKKQQDSFQKQSFFKRQMLPTSPTMQTKEANQNWWQAVSTQTSKKIQTYQVM
jgi:hypothetical protein